MWFIDLIVSHLLSLLTRNPQCSSCPNCCYEYLLTFSSELSHTSPRASDKRLFQDFSKIGMCCLLHSLRSLLLFIAGNSSLCGQHELPEPWAPVASLREHQRIEIPQQISLCNKTIFLEIDCLRSQRPKSFLLVVLVLQTCWLSLWS